MPPGTQNLHFCSMSARYGRGGSRRPGAADAYQLDPPTQFTLLSKKSVVGFPSSSRADLKRARFISTSQVTPSNTGGRWMR